MKQYRPHRVYIESIASHLAMTERILQQLDLPPEAITYFEKYEREVKRPEVSWQARLKGARSILVIAARPDMVLRKENFGALYARPNTYHLRHGGNCAYHCEYCYLWASLKHTPELFVFADVDHMFTTISEEIRTLQSNETILINAGEDNDALVIDDLTGLSRELIPFFSLHPSARLELRTKSSNVANLMDLDHNGQTIIAFSMNCPEAIRLVEHGTALLQERIWAAQQCQIAGYRVAFKFEPLLCLPNWEAGYERMVHQIFSQVDCRLVDHFSLGTLRYRGLLKDAILSLYPKTRLFEAAFEMCAPGQFTYPFHLRYDMYNSVLQYIRSYAPDIPYYLSVESPDMVEAFGNPRYIPC